MDTLDGLTVQAALDRLLALAQDERPIEGATVRVEKEGCVEEREWGFCQQCGFTLVSCVCEFGPY